MTSRLTLFSRILSAVFAATVLLSATVYAGGTAVGTFTAIHGSPAGWPAADNSTPLKYGVMPITPAQKAAESSYLLHAPTAQQDEQVRQMLMARNGVGQNFSLLPRLSYIPSERSQGDCGNCWVWAGTGLLEIAMNVQKDISERFSIQYFNSVYQNGTGVSWACCGGNALRFAEIYRDILRKTVPWANPNAAYRDQSQACATSTTVAAGTITATPYYMISSIGPAEQVTTYNIPETEAILNIKNILHQNKAVIFVYCLASRADWTIFQNWWDANPESAIWDQGYSCGKPWTITGSAHATVCVGYNDEDPDPAKHYWLILNSWGTADGARPAGTFRIPMHYDYDCADTSGSRNTQWWSIPVTFADNSRSRQVNTASGTITISADSGSLDSASIVGPSSYANQGLPTGSVLPYGVFTFTENNLAPGATVRFTLALPGPPPPGLQLWKLQNGAWTNCTSLLGGMGDEDNVIYLTITDGGQGDTDGATNGSIVDPCALLMPGTIAGFTGRAATHGASLPTSTTPMQPIPLPNIFVRSAAVSGEDSSPQVKAEVTNNGAAGGVDRITLYVDGQAAGNRDISLAPGNSTTVTFDLTGTEPGNHRVTVNSTPAGSVTIGGGFDWWFAGSLFAFLLTVTALFALHLRKKR